MKPKELPPTAYENHCVAEFEQLANTDPVELIRLARTELAADPVAVAQVAEALALSRSHKGAVVAFLLQLLSHLRPFVREAAIHGLSPFFETVPEARPALERMAASDPSPGVRDAASDVLELR